MQIHHVQAIRKLVLLAGVLVGLLIFAVTETRFPNGSFVHWAIEWVGLILIVVCILGRTWATLYIGGRKIEELVKTGPYSATRNPLYFFSVIGSIGIGAQFGSVTIALLCGLIAFAVFWTVINQEEKVLVERYGEEFLAYKAAVPRIVPNIRLWREEPILTIHPSRVRRTFGDALFFLMAWPIAEGFEMLQAAGVFPILFSVP